MNKILVVFIAFLMIGCDDFVDIEPKGSAIVENLQHIDLLLNEGTSLSGSGVVRQDISCLVNDNSKITKSELDALSTSYDRDLYNTYTLKDLFFDADLRDNEWSGYYVALARSNFIISEAQKVQGDETLKKHYAAEAMVHRCYALFTLVNIYGHHYKTEHASKAESGVPVIDKFADDGVSLKRKSVNEVYDVITGELTDAVANLKEERPRVDRVNKASAQALLSKVYLHMGNYEQALIMAEEALKYNSFLYNYNSLENNIVPKGVDNKEAVLFKESRILTGGNYPNTRGLVAFSDELKNLFKDQQNDCRVSKIPGNDKEGNIVWGYSNYRLMSRSVGVTVPELMLIKAECLARKGDHIKALEQVNHLRKHRFTTEAIVNESYKLDASNKEIAIQVVLEERRREFHTDGRRFFDIKRLNAIENAGISLKRGDKEWKPNSINWAAPIPEQVITDSKGEISQNLRE